MLRSLLLITACLLGSGIARAQGFPFQIRVQQGATIASIGNGGSIGLNASNVGAGTVTLGALSDGGTPAAVTVTDANKLDIKPSNPVGNMAKPGRAGVPGMGGGGAH